MFDPATSHSEEMGEAAMQRALRTKHTMYEYWDQPENAVALRRFQIGMKGTANYSSDALIVKGTRKLDRLVSIRKIEASITGFDWAALPEGSIVVDVAGGVGNVTMALAERHKHLRYIIQDRPPVVKAADAVSICFQKIQQTEY